MLLNDGACPCVDLNVCCGVLLFPFRPTRNLMTVAQRTFPCVVSLHRGRRKLGASTQSMFFAAYLAFGVFHFPLVCMLALPQC